MYKSKLKGPLFVVAFIVCALVLGHPFPPLWDDGAGQAVHYQPVAWPDEPSPASCGDACGDWKPYTRFSKPLTDPRVQDPSNGGTAPQSYVNVSSSCSDKQQPSIYYHLHRDNANPAKDVIMFRWRVEQGAHNYATGPNPGNYNASSPWNSALWTVLFDLDGSGYRSLAAHLNGSSGSPGAAVDLLAAIWSDTPSQSLDYATNPDIHLLTHNPTGFVGSTRLLNFRNALNPTETWSNGAAETVWDYGTTRATLVTNSPCSEYFIDYQIPVAMLDASAHGGAKITRDTPISMLFCTSNSLKNPFQKDCAINRQWTSDATRPAPFGDYLSFNKEEPFQQPIVSSVTAAAPTSCPGSYTLTTKIRDTLAVQNGVVVTSLKSVHFYYWLDRNGDGEATAADTGSTWTQITPAATLVPQTLNTWTASWDATSLPKGRYLIGVQAVDDTNALDDNMVATGVDNRTFSYLTGDAENRVYIDSAWASGQQAAFPAHSPVQTPGSQENWYGNPSITGSQVALVGTTLNACGIAPTIDLIAAPGSVAGGATVGFTITVGNPSTNSSAITLDSLGNLLPTGFTYVASSSSGTNGVPSIEPIVNGQQLAWTFGSPVSIAPGTSAALSFSATAASAAGTYSNTASASTSFGPLTSAPAQIVVDSARLSLSMTPSAYSIAANGSSTLIYTLSYANISGVPVTNASISDALPAGVTYSSCSGGSSCSNSSGTVTWSLGVLAAGASGTATLTITVPSNYNTYSVVNSATLSATAPDASTVNASATATVAVTGVPVPGTPAFTLAASANVVAVAPGGTVTYTLSYSNYGTASASSVVLTDTLPTGMTYSSCSDSCSQGSGIITWNIGTVAAGASGSRTVTVTVANPFTATNPAVNTGSINWSGGTPVTSQVNVGVTGQSCSTYYFQNATANVGTDGVRSIASATPVPISSNTGASVTVLAPQSDEPFLEALRFYQDPETANDVPFNGNITTNIYIDRVNGQGINIRTTVYDYQSSNGSKTQLGQNTTQFGGNTKGLLTFTVTPTGTLLKGHRLLWVYEVQTDHASQNEQVQLQYAGTVANAFSPGSTFANSRASYCVTPPANLTLSNQVSSASITEGTTPVLTYTLRYANAGGTAATSTSLVAALPNGSTNCQYSTDNNTWSTCSSSGSSPPSHTFSIGSLAGGASSTVYVRGNAPSGATAGSTLTGAANITSTQTSAVNADAVTTVAAASSGTAALALNLSADRTTAAPGADVVYTLTVINTGSAAASNVIVSNTVPSTAYYTYSSCTGSCDVAGNVLTWPTIASLAAGASQSFTYTMHAGTSGLPSGVTTISDSASTSATGGLSATSNTVAVTLNGNPVLSLLNSPSPSSGLSPGDTITYTITVSNSGAADATAVTVTNPIAANTTFSGNITASTGSGSFDPVANRMTFDVGTLASGASATLSFDVVINSPLPSGPTTLSSTATLAASNAGQQSVTANASASAAPSLSIVKTAPSSVALPAAVLTAAAAGTQLFVDRTDRLQIGQLIKIGSDVTRITGLSAKSITVDDTINAISGTAVVSAITLTITYRNTGDADATATTLRETLDTGFGYYSASPTATSSPIEGSSGDIDWTLGTLSAGASATVEVIAFPTGSTGSFSNTATLSAVNATDATATTVTSVGGLSVTKTTSTQTLSAATDASYTIIVSNSLGSDVSPVTVSDVLPEGFTYKAGSATVDGIATEPTFAAEDTTQTQPSWTGLTVPAADSLVIAFQAEVASSSGAGVYQNQVDVSAPGSVGVMSFDALLTTSEDVTILAAATGVLKGYVYQRDGGGNALPFNGTTDTPLAGVEVELHKAGADCASPVNGNCYVVHTDGNGYFEQVLPAEDWIVTVVDGTGDLASGWRQISGQNDNTVSVPDQGSVIDYNGFTSVPASSYLVSTSAGPNGEIDPTSRTVLDGDTTTFTVTPDSGFSISSVTGCDGSRSGSTYTTGPITGACTVSASFVSNTVPTHTVTASAGTGGSIDPTNATVAEGDTTSFTVTADAGYSISSVTGCNGSLSGATYTTDEIVADCDVTASFVSNSVPTHTVTATAGTGGSINPDDALVAEGDTTSFTVTANTGYSISTVTGCGGSLNGTTYTTDEITADCTVNASFVANTYLVSTSAGAGGALSPTSANVSYGQTTSFTVTPDAGFNISTVTGCDGSLSGNTYTTDEITGACTVSATFISASIPTHAVSTTVVGGGAISPDSALIAEGSTTSFTLTPDTGYHLVGVSGCSGSLVDTTYTTDAITAACTVTATFVQNTYTVSSTAGAGGTISPPNTIVTHGDTTTFTVTPADSHNIASVSGCGGSLSGTTFTTGAITGACTVSASFILKAYAVQTSAGTGGTIAPSLITVPHGDTTSFTVTPDASYSISSVSGCGGSLNGTTYTTDTITSGCTVTASFVSNSVPTHVVSTSAGTGGSIDPTSAVIEEGDTTTFTVTPDTGYTIAAVSGCGGSLSGSTYTTGEITQACTVSATFTAITYTVEASAQAGGSISPPSTVVVHGDTASFTVTPDTNYSISSVSGCGGSLNGNLYTTAAVTEACSVNASFVSNSTPTHAVSTSAGAGGSIDPMSAVIAEGDTTTFTVTPDVGYTIASVSGCNGSLSGSTYTTGAITAACTVSATFSAITYSVSASAGTGGTISPTNTTVIHGATTNFTVTADANYSISSVSGCGGTLNGNVYTTAPITEACAVNASFVSNSTPTHAVSTSAGLGGSIDPTSALIAEGSTTTFTVTADAGYTISSASGCGGSLSGSTFTTGAITAACTVSASFSAITHTLSASAGTGGAISPSSIVVNQGGTTAFTVTAETGYDIESVTGCGGALLGTTYTTGVITNACSVTATFVRKAYLVAASAGAGGSINPTSASVLHGNTASFTITPNANYRIASVSGCNGSLSSNIYTTGAITAACSVAATFALAGPQFGPAPPVSVNARSLFTDVPLNIAPRATDANGVELAVTLVGETKLRPGRHTLTWRAQDSTGNVITTEQIFDIWPTISISDDFVVSYGNAASFQVVLNGEAPVYPFSVAFTVGGDGGLGTRHTLAPGLATFNSGTEASVHFNTLPQSTSLPTQRLIVTLDPTANIGMRGTLTISLISANAAPLGEIIATQEDRIGTLVARTSGAIVLNAVVDDPNPLDTHILRWTAPVGAVTQPSSNGRELVVDATSLRAGVNEFSVLITDNGQPSLSSRASIALAVLETAPTLGLGDANGNSIADIDEGWSDSGNGIPAYLNRNSAQRNVLPEDAPVTERFLIEGDAGVHLKIGVFAQLNGSGGARLPNASAASFVGTDVVTNVGGYFDVQAQQLASLGQVVHIVIPQRQPIPSQPVYRLWDAQTSRWATFVEDANNKLWSAPGSEGYCPPPGSTEYQPGLTPGHWCAQVAIEDGGPDDTDRQRNGAFMKSGGIGVLRNSVVTGTSGSSGGGAMDLWLLAFIASALLLQRLRLLACFVAVVLVLPITTKAQDRQHEEEPGFYVSLAAAYVQGSIDATDMDSRLAAQGFTTSTDLSGQSRIGGMADAGYRWRYFGIELGYTHLGQLRTVVAGNTPVNDEYLRAISLAHPRSGSGPKLSALAFIPVSERIELLGRAGLFYWRTTMSAEGLGQYTDVKGRQLDPTFGIGARMRLSEKFSIQLEIDRYRLDGEDIDAAAFGVIYRLGDVQQ